MDYKKTIEDFFKKLRDHKTISGIPVPLNDVEYIKIHSTPKPQREKPLRRYREGKNSFAILLQDGCIDYDNEITNVLHAITHYLTTVSGEMRPHVFSQIHEVINQAKKTLTLNPGKDGPEFDQCEKDIQYLFNTGEFPPQSDLQAYIKAMPKTKGKGTSVDEIRTSWFAKYDMQPLYDSCIMARLVKMFEIITKLNTQLGQNEKEITGATRQNIVKLNWAGAHNQLYGVIQELKEQEFITNSNNEIADFLKQSVSCFHKTAKVTIERELGKNYSQQVNLKAEKRIKLNYVKKKAENK